MLRHLLNLLTALSLLLCVAVVVLWVVIVTRCTMVGCRDYSMGWSAGRVEPSTFRISQYHVVVGRGELVVIRDARTWANPVPSYVPQFRERYDGWPRNFSHGYGSAYHGPNQSLWNKLGFRREHSVNVIESIDEPAILYHARKRTEP